MSTVTYSADEGTLASYATRQIEKYYPDLKRVRIMYVWRSKARSLPEGGIILASARRLNPKLRDLMNIDVEIEVAEPEWKEASKDERRRLMFHELNHVVVERTDSGKLKRDKAGRVRIKIRPHDVVIKTFSDEIKRFGPDEPTYAQARFINSCVRQKSGNGKKKGGDNDE